MPPLLTSPLPPTLSSQRGLLNHRCCPITHCFKSRPQASDSGPAFLGVAQADGSGLMSCLPVHTDCCGSLHTSCGFSPRGLCSGCCFCQECSPLFLCLANSHSSFKTQSTHHLRCWEVLPDPFFPFWALGCSSLTWGIGASDLPKVTQLVSWSQDLNLCALGSK